MPARMPRAYNPPVSLDRCVQQTLQRHRLPSAPDPRLRERATIMRPDASRLPAVDALRAIACVLIVLYHLAFTV